MRKLHRIATRIFNSPAIIWSDLILLSLSLALATFAGYQQRISENPATYLNLRVSVRNLFLFALCLASWRLSLWTIGLYRSISTGDLIKRVIAGVLLCTPAAVFSLLLRHTGGTILWPLVLFIVSGCFLLICSRGVFGFSAMLFHEHARPKRVAVIIGSGTIAQKLAEDLLQSTTSDYAIEGFFDSEVQSGGRVMGRHLGNIEQLSDLLMHTAVDDVFIGLPLRSHYEEIQHVVEIVESAGIQTQFPANIVLTTIAKRLHHEQDRVVMQMVHHDNRRYIKRIFDLLIAAFLLVLLLPMFLLVAVSIRLSSEGPVFFRQQRYGLNKRRFWMYKFRSMVLDAEKKQGEIEHLNETSGPVFKMKSDPRVTWVGSMLRQTSIDELPQLWNVLRGEMSLVGPRPLPLRDVGRFAELRLMRRFSVLPGMTGLWQVSGRSEMGFDDLLDHDLRYIDQWTLMLDLEILARTIPVVLGGKGAS